MKTRSAGAIRDVVARTGLTLRWPSGRVLPQLARRYGRVTPRATYSPWNLDEEFLTAFAVIQAHTLVDLYRCFELWRLVEQVAKLAPGDLIEVGTWRGGTGALMALQARRLQMPGRVYLCDTFCGVVKAGAADSFYRGREHADTSRGHVESLVFGDLGLRNVEILEGIFPDQTGPAAEGARFRLCHIDVDVYHSAQDVEAWVWDRLVPGGVIVYDDYGFRSCDGIARHVEEQLPRPDRLVLHNLNGHAIVIKL